MTPHHSLIADTSHRAIVALWAALCAAYAGAEVEYEDMIRDDGSLCVVFEVSSVDPADPYGTALAYFLERRGMVWVFVASDDLATVLALGATRAACAMDARRTILAEVEEAAVLPVDPGPGCPIEAIKNSIARPSGASKRLQEAIH